MKKHCHALIFSITSIVVLLQTHVCAQVKDIFNPALYGKVKVYKEYIVRHKDTLRSVVIWYGEDGQRSKQHTISQIPGTPYVNSTMCWVKKGDSILAKDCNNDSSVGSVVLLKPNGNILQADVKADGKTVSYIPEYNSRNLIRSMNMAKSENHQFQIFATSTFEYDTRGRILKTTGEGGDQPQGTTIYTYNTRGQLTKSVRSDKDGTPVFETDYFTEDSHGNWLAAVYQNGLKVMRDIEYY